MNQFQMIEMFVEILVLRMHIICAIHSNGEVQESSSYSVLVIFYYHFGNTEVLDAQHRTQRRIQCTHLHAQADIYAHSNIGIGLFVAETRLYANTSYESRFGGEIVMCAFAIISPWKSVQTHTQTHTHSDQLNKKGGA